MTEWVTQAQAVERLAAAGDKISQPALSQYLAGHREVPRQEGGPGRPTLIDFAALLTSRQTRRGRGTASVAAPGDPAPAELPLVPKQAPPLGGDQPPPDNTLAARKAVADTERAEHDARRAKISADEAEGRVIQRDTAVNAFIAAGVALTRAMEENRRYMVDQVRAAKDPREAALAATTYERKVRTAFANSLAELAALADPEAAAAQ